MSLKDIRKNDRFAEELEKAFQPREDGDRTAFKFGWHTALLVLFCGVVIASLALPLYFGTPTDPASGVWVEGMPSQIG